MNSLPAAVRNYYMALPSAQSEELLVLRDQILKLLPTATEVMKYSMPTFVVDEVAICGILANKKHIGFYPYSGQVLRTLPEILENYSTTDGAWHIPYGKKTSNTHLKLVIKTRLDEVDRKKSKKAPADTWQELGLAAPASRALTQAKISNLTALSKRSKSEILELHGMGPAALARLELALKKANLDFKSK